MATLQGQEIKDTYQALLKTDGNTIISSSLQAITDGQGNTTVLSLSTEQLLVSGGLIVGTIDDIMYSTEYISPTNIITTPFVELYIEMGAADINTYQLSISQTSNTVIVPGNISSTVIGPVTYFYASGSNNEWSELIDFYNYPDVYPYYYDDLQITNITYDAGTNQSTITFAGNFASSYPKSYKPIPSSSVSLYSLNNGLGNQAIGQYSHAEGQLTTTVGSGSHTEGSGSLTIGSYSHAEGVQTTAIGGISHAEGYKTTAKGGYSHAEGISTIAANFNSHAEGAYTIAIGDASHAEGSNTAAVGAGSHAEGVITTAIGAFSHAEGALTTTIGQQSHTEGVYTTAIGSFSHAEGLYTIASGSLNNGTLLGIPQHAEGRYNVVDTSSLLIVGNGTADNARKNAFAVTTFLTASITSSTVVLQQVSESVGYANDAAAAAGGIPLGGLYHSSGTIKIRLV